MWEPHVSERFLIYPLTSSLSFICVLYLLGQGGDRQQVPRELKLGLDWRHRGRSPIPTISIYRLVDDNRGQQRERLRLRPSPPLRPPSRQSRRSRPAASLQGGSHGGALDGAAAAATEESHITLQ